MFNSCLIDWAERGWLPDYAVRLGIRRLLRRRLNQAALEPSVVLDFAQRMRDAPLVTAAAEANAQHYEVPTEFFQQVLGKRLKYSCGFWSENCKSLDDAEEEMLALTCQHAQLSDGMNILELGCGWGSLTLWMAENYPAAQIVAISNSASQRAHIERRAVELRLKNVRILTRDVAEFDTTWRFDRVVSVEMFEHIRNHAELFRRVSRWLTPAGKLFVHIFCHRVLPYTFEMNSSSDWMARHFFTGGLMPSAGLFNEYRDHLTIANQWQINGRQYSQTCEAWLSRLDNHQEQLMNLLSRDCDSATARIRLQRWRMFFMACAELFAYRGGREWFVSHYLLEHARQLTSVA